jgi:hypothetical protein
MKKLDQSVYNNQEPTTEMNRRYLERTNGLVPEQNAKPILFSRRAVRAYNISNDRVRATSTGQFSCEQLLKPFFSVLSGQNVLSANIKFV